MQNNLEVEDVLELIEKNALLIKDMSKALVRYAKSKERVRIENARLDIYEIDEIISEARSNVAELMEYLEEADPDEIIDVLADGYKPIVIAYLSDEVIENMQYALEDTLVDRYDELTYVIGKEYNARKMQQRLKSRKNIKSQ